MKQFNSSNGGSNGLTLFMKRRGRRGASINKAPTSSSESCLVLLLLGSPQPGRTLLVASEYCGGSVMAAKVVAVVQVVSLLLLVVVGSHAAEGAGVSCGDALNALIPCTSYLVGAGGATPSDGCCRGAQNLDRMAPTADARRSLCECFKQTAPSFGVNPQRVRSLPALCNIKLTVVITPNVDCSKIA
ncbi:non-specific lipid-transfer protein 3-like [Nymphaea colorata]|nr:non-specific lipid-transfer protein 3-like [Nymphaea colorata]